MTSVKVLTTTLCYPTPAHPDQGVFVQRRALALSQIIATRSPAGQPGSVRVVAPQTWCPMLRRYRPADDQNVPIQAYYPRLFSIPVLGWATDGISYACTLIRTIRSRSQDPQADIDLIDAHFVYPDGVGAWLAGRRLGIPVCVTVRGKIVSLSRRAVRRLQIRAMLRGVDARIAVSRSLAAWVHDVAGSDLVVDVIPNGIDATTFHMVDRQRCRSLLGWSPNARYVLAVGHLQKLKGFDRLVSIMSALRAAAGDVQLVLAGSRRGEKRFARTLLRQIKAYNHEVENEGHGPCIHFTGPVDSEQLNLMYNAANVMVNASRSEGWNNAIGEALAAGTPVVATDVGGNPEQIDSPALGAIVPDGQSSALAEAVEKALSRPWNRLFIARHACKRTWHTVADDVQKVFDRILADRHKTPFATANKHPAGMRMPHLPTATEGNT